MSAVHPLQGEQALAVDPEHSVWLSASAGTGKTQVLSARVLRLLLQPDVRPSQILCLTFTKAGAAEMAERVNNVLARWVRLPPARLAAELQAIGADFRPAAIDRARSLFASVLDCPGGGLRIDTIHAFAQWLLSAFPEEAGLSAGTRAMEDRDRDLLSHEVLASMLLKARQSDDSATLEAIAALSLDIGPDGVQKWLMRCAAMSDLWFGPGAWAPPLDGRVRQLLGLASDASEADLEAMCGDETFPFDALRLCHSAFNQWNVKTGQKGRVVIARWLAADTAERLSTLEDLFKILFSQKDTVKDAGSLAKFEQDYESAATEVLEHCLALRDLRIRLDLARQLAPALELGRRFAFAWDEAKRREGLIDFDDQIRAAAALLGQRDLSDWIRYKLDREFDHVLIDEAQDTNAAQWDIIFGLIDEYFSGEGARGQKIRTVFTVGDYKQAIFRFQGTSPENFEQARKRVRDAMEQAAHNAEQLRANHRSARLRELGLGRSFRTGQPVLDFVNAVLEKMGHARFGLKQPSERHVGDERPGLVVLWPALGGKSESEDGETAETLPEVDAEADEAWLSAPERQMADKIAEQVKAWLDEGFPLAKGKNRNAGPGDIMVLVRKRGALAGLIVARLYAAGVPVAGVDRLRLGAPLAVKDLLAALRFAVQPYDDLSLANLLVSPLIGWSQQQLLDHGWRPEKVPLWSHLRASRDPEVVQAREMLGDLLARADFEPPQALLHWMLIGPWQGRRKLTARLGREANDPIDELLNEALAFSSSHTPSLQGFIQWFDANRSDLKREAVASDTLVRVMTVHGSKGLQAPIVILADATGNPENAKDSGLVLEEDADPAIAHRHKVPILPVPKAQRAGRLSEAFDRAAAEEMEEHWRLLYVAMTRAEEALFIGGALGRREKEPAEQSWYRNLMPLFGDEMVDDAIWGWRKQWGRAPVATATGLSPAMPEAALPFIPPWAHEPVIAEPRPPRPLAPSALGNDEAADPPLGGADMQLAARRGTLIHAMLERLPAIEPSGRRAAAIAWLERRGGGFLAAERAEMADAVLAVIEDSRWAEIFAPDALAEVPLAGVVEGQVLAGTIDRLLVTPEGILVVDFKSARRPPARLEEVPVSTLRQMAAYVAALEAIYPGRKVEAALLYTHTPLLIALPEDCLIAHRPRGDG